MLESDHLSRSPLLQKKCGCSAFRQLQWGRYMGGSVGFNPSIGLTSVPTYYRAHYPRKLWCFNPSIGLTSVPTVTSQHWWRGWSCVSIPQSGLQAFRLGLGRASLTFNLCFNPSIGLTSVPTGQTRSSDH